MDLFILRATDAQGAVTYYTGRAGATWVGPNRAEAFSYSEVGARHKAELFNGRKAMHGLTFDVISA